MGTPTPSRARLLVARIRMPFLAVSALAFLAAAILDVPGWLALVALGAFVVGLALYSRLGTPVGPTADLANPVRGRWVALNSPTTRVPSHLIHAWAQTYAVDLVCDPADGSRPGVSWSPLAAPADRLPRVRPAGAIADRRRGGAGPVGLA